jgi:hypothetical protein
VLFAVLALGCAAGPVREPEPAPAEAPPTSAEAQLRARDERRPDQPLTIDVAGHPVRLGGSWEYTDEQRKNFDLDDTRQRDRRVREHEVKVEARTRLDPQTEFFMQLVGLYDTRRTQGAGGVSSHSLERGPMWLQFEHLGGTPWLLQVGRLALVERRAWWWDEDLDGLRLQYAGKGWSLDTGVLREAARQSSAERGIAADARGVTRWFGQATWPWARRHALAAFWLLQRDDSGRPAPGTVFADEDSTDPRDFNGGWVGARASGEWRGEGTLRRLAYAADLAWVSGREQVTRFDERDDSQRVAGTTQGQRVRGHAFDAAATATFGLPLRPSFTLAYARGSEGFRQTGLQENKGRFGGVKRWQRYGELLQPELANLEVASVGAGIRLAASTSLELMVHHFRQVRAAGTQAGSRLAADPQGTGRALGNEVDLLLAIRESRRVEFTVKASYFRPGSAFAPGRRDPARSLELGMTLNF